MIDQVDLKGEQPDATASVKQVTPLALINGEPVKEWPADLFIPPEALEVFLETFEGPLDLLLYLIRKQKLDVVDLPLQKITAQYLEYIELLTEAKIELAADYLVMAATLAEIKSRLLLPRSPFEDEDDVDPRVRLIQQLQAYEVIKNASEQLDDLPRLNRDVYQAKVMPPLNIKPELLMPDVALRDIASAFSAVLSRVEACENHQVIREVLSTRERMSQILSMLNSDTYTAFSQLFTYEEGRSGVVVTFLALMELVKELLVTLYQREPLAVIYVKAL